MKVTFSIFKMLVLGTAVMLVVPALSFSAPDNRPMVPGAGAMAPTVPANPAPAASDKPAQQSQAPGNGGNGDGIDMETACKKNPAMFTCVDKGVKCPSGTTYVGDFTGGGVGPTGHVCVKTSGSGGGGNNPSPQPTPKPESPRSW